MKDKPRNNIKYECYVTYLVIILNFKYIPKNYGSVEFQLGARVVLDLYNGFKNKNRVVFMNNFFSNNILFKQLLNKIMYACGTIIYNLQTLIKLQQVTVKRIRLDNK